MAERGCSVAGQAYVRRVVDEELDWLLTSLPAVALEGPKAVGKTMTALQRAATVGHLDDAQIREVVGADPQQVVAGDAPVLVDEWQRFPESWDRVRRAVDDDPTPGRFLLTGSAPGVHQPVHSGAGRIVSVAMRPMSLQERWGSDTTVSLAEMLAGGPAPIGGRCDATLGDYVEEIVASGFPAIRAITDRRARQAQLDSYIEAVIRRDFDEAGYPVRKPALLRRWLRAYAAATATTASYEAVRDAATPGEADKPAKSTVQAYRDVLEALRLVEPVPAWIPQRSPLQELGHASKHHLADPALAARLLNVDASALLGGFPVQAPSPRDGTLLGQLFESLVTLCVRVYAQAAGARVAHLRQHRGRREIDLVVQGDDHRLVALEVKLSATVDGGDTKHLQWLRDQLGEDLADAAVITTGSYAYRRRDGIAVVPAALLGP